MAGLWHVDKPKFSSMLTLRVEFKERIYKQWDLLILYYLYYFKGGPWPSGAKYPCEIFAPLEKCVGHRLKHSLGSSQKNICPWCPKLVTGLCSRKLTMTSLTRSAWSVVPKRTHSCGFPSTFGFWKVAVGIWADALLHARNLNSCLFDLATTTLMPTELFRGIVTGFCIALNYWGKHKEW